MRSIIFLSPYVALFPLMLGAAELRVDHVTACGADLQQMRAALTTIGIPSEYGGPHNNHATEMALTSFSDGSYLEQIALQPKGDAKAIDAHEWSKQMKGNSGPCAWAVRPADIAAEVKRLHPLIQVTAPERAGRNRPDGTRLDWETSQVGSMARGTFYPFLIRDFTPREARAFPSGKPSTAEFTGVARVVIGVRDLEKAIGDYRKVYDLPEAERQTDEHFGAKLAYLRGGPVILAAPLDAQSWLAARLEQFGDGPCALILRNNPQPITRRLAVERPSSGTQWFGSLVSWFDVAKLGWRLGVE
jgi:hypothetical protein